MILIFLGLQIFHNVAFTFILYQGLICFLIPIIDLFIIKKLSIKEAFHLLGFYANTNNQKKGILIGISLGILYASTIFLLYFFLKDYLIDIKEINILFREWNINNRYSFTLIFVMIFGNPVLEEIYWRGYIMDRLTFPKSIFITSFFYALYHLIPTINFFSIIYGIVFAILIFCTGLIWAYLRYKFKSIYPSIISHFAADLAIMIIFFRIFID